MAPNQKVSQDQLLDRYHYPVRTSPLSPQHRPGLLASNGAI